MSREPGQNVSLILDTRWLVLIEYDDEVEPRRQGYSHKQTGLFMTGLVSLIQSPPTCLDVKIIHHVRSDPECRDGELLMFSPGLTPVSSGSRHCGIPNAAP